MKKLYKILLMFIFGLLGSTSLIWSMEVRITTLIILIPIYILLRIHNRKPNKDIENEN